MKPFLTILFCFIFLGHGLTQPIFSSIHIDLADTPEKIIYKAAHVIPTPNQYQALKNEFIAFIHFGPNTFTRMEWGSGKEDPAIFNLQNLDTDQWCRAMVAAGMKMVIITAKHHDGFCLWQSRYTTHGVMSSPFKDGNGDIMRELAASCKKYGLKLGIYLSPADLYQIENPEGLYGNLSKYIERVIPRPVLGRPFANPTQFKFVVDDYNEYFLNQLFELLTEYGPIHEVWFDGAHPKRKGGQTYHYAAWKELIQKLVPEAVIFGRQDIRWCGNESGKTRDTEWNIIPYQKDPNQMNSFPDITAKDIGSRSKLLTAKYLHYQPAETNTSIREGWFYRDEELQKVRSADDVFDMYERSVGGNSIFLLNIPPNREGKFSPEDVQVLEEVGQRIQNTYSQNLLYGASGQPEVLDGDGCSYKLLSHNEPILEFLLPDPITINRFVIQEAIASYGERVESHALDALIDGTWQEIAAATNIGYKRILRFPQVTSDRFRLRILEFRAIPAIANVAAHYYKTRPPQLEIKRNLDGMVSIHPRKHQFHWKPHGENESENVNIGIKIYYTLDGSDPDQNSRLYKEPFFHQSGEIKAVAIDQKKMGSTTSHTFGMVKKGWKLIRVDSYLQKNEGSKAFDGNTNTYWRSEDDSEKHQIFIDLGAAYKVNGFVYTPPEITDAGMIEKGVIKTSMDGKTWKSQGSFKFGNLINDPTPRTHYFKSEITLKYLQIISIDIAGNSKSAAIAEIDLLER